MSLECFLGHLLSRPSLQGAGWLSERYLGSHQPGHLADKQVCVCLCTCTYVHQPLPAPPGWRPLPSLLTPLRKQAAWNHPTCPQAQPLAPSLCQPPVPCCMAPFSSLFRASWASPSATVA